MLRDGESNPGHLRDRQRCYQLHHDGRELFRGAVPARARFGCAGVRAGRDTLVVRSYQGEHSASHPNCELKHP